MEFGISITYQRKIYFYTVKQEYKDDRVERYRVIAANKTLLLECNRPIIRKYSKTRQPNWTLLEGKVDSSSGLDDIRKAIMAVIDK